MPRSSKGAAVSRPRARKLAPDPRAEIRRFITNLDRLAPGPFAPPAARAVAENLAKEKP